MRLFFTFIAFFMCFSASQAQFAKDATVPITATLGTGPTSITLSWPNPGNASLLMLRRAKGQAGNAWQLVLNLGGSNVNSIIDTGVSNGQTYEYVLQQFVNGIFSFGYVHVAVNANPVNTRGKILIFVDSTSADALGPELARLKNDLRGDGWWPIPFKTGPSSTVQSVKNQIVTSYNADPTNVKAVLLFGDIPVPYSGSNSLADTTIWDGHPDHNGAWPSDAYYADVNGVWTDNTANITNSGRAANNNIPGDGKFDQSRIPSQVELQVGRVDFTRLDAAAFGAADHIGLLKRYLDKNHRWRNGDYTVDNKALVDDNFGYFGGEAFAANGYRNAYPLVGEANIVEGDFFNDTDNQSFLLGYGCGAGGYSSADGVGSSANFATDSVNIVFSNLFGSYHGDWDYESNPFMPSALASRGGILTCSWAGRPHYFYQALASGETIGFVTWEAMNARYNNGYFGSYGEGGAHVSLLGDPSLRAHVVKPAKDVVVTSPTCSSVLLNWTASADVVTGYHIYRSLSQDGPYTRLTANPVTGTSYTDLSPQLDTLYYQVRAIKNVTTPGGGTYANNATGAIAQFIFSGAGGPIVTATGGTLTCTSLTTLLSADANNPITNWSWIGPNNFTSTLQNPTVSNVGTYTVTGTDAAGCSSTATVAVVGDFAGPTINATVSNSINCANTSATIEVDPAGLSLSTITGPLGFFVQGFTATATMSGNYTITATSATNGCIGNKIVTVISDVIIPTLTASNGGDITCLNTSTELMATSNAASAGFAWDGPCVVGTTATCAGIYTVTVTNQNNGCTNTASTTVVANVVIPGATAQGGEITCAVTEVPLIATSNVGGVTFQWTGPCVSGGPQFMASCPGDYTVVVTNSVNGCTNSATTTVTENTTPPSVNLSPLPTLTCVMPCADFVVPSIPGIQLFLAGQLLPPGFPIMICQPGVITIQAVSVANGCSTDVDVQINQDITPPDADAGPDAILSCGTPTVQLSGNSSTNGATFLWTGPGGFSSSEQNPSVSLPGVYILTVTNPANGCTTSDQTSVTADNSLPTVNATASGVLNCANTSVLVNSGNNNPSATYSWIGPNGFISNEPSPLVTEPGTYTVVVTIGACTASDVVEVGQAPEFMVTASPATINCSGQVSTCVVASGGTPPYTYAWSNGSTGSCATYTGTSTIGVSVTDAGGCSFIQEATVVVPPVLTVGIQTSVGCTGFAIVCAAASGGVAPYMYQWSGGASTPCVTFLNGGSYTVTTTDAAGCTAVFGVTLQIPPAIATTAVITNESAPNANNGAINLTVVGGTAPFAYLWSNGATTEDLTALLGGTYTVVVTDANGCTQTGSYTVLTTSSTTEDAYFALFQLSPNPTEGLTMLSLKLHQSEEIRIEVYDMSGRLILENPTLETDALNLPIDLSNQPAGMYSVSVWIDNQVFVRKLTVMR
ncbi:MAG: T9SS type A sorting domain-containing protein [Lewinellaceae bacterium]|nr:T9SS type A sorting domain-containing protein [Lewinellaceae bacterium]